MNSWKYGTLNRQDKNIINRINRAKEDKEKELSIIMQRNAEEIRRLDMKQAQLMKLSSIKNKRLFRKNDTINITAYSLYLILMVEEAMKNKGFVRLLQPLLKDNYMLNILTVEYKLRNTNFILFLLSLLTGKDKAEFVVSINEARIREDLPPIIDIVFKNNIAQPIDIIEHLIYNSQGSEDIELLKYLLRKYDNEETYDMIENVINNNSLSEDIHEILNEYMTQ